MPAPLPGAPLSRREPAGVERSQVHDSGLPLGHQLRHGQPRDGRPEDAPTVVPGRHEGVGEPGDGAHHGQAVGRAGPHAGLDYIRALGPPKRGGQAPEAPGSGLHPGGVGPDKPRVLAVAALLQPVAAHVVAAPDATDVDLAVRPGVDLQVAPVRVLGAEAGEGLLHHRLAVLVHHTSTFDTLDGHGHSKPLLCPD
eukprot:CAMPEP_0194571996 /NCGR_PEP_ID=MMETSP0292-20121207/8753_1 /TAXON_ID=39354 /ORGANISM="Heterosigma akashiwo, Strain CCMP2393" /LENGTH=195 /DNA_ID=CAMNT_0039422887 /DNA_START=268 /DNA_END=855 /DNA_ORIENTATION=+